MEKKMNQSLPHDLGLLDIIPLAIIAAAWTDIVPSIAAVFAIGWYCILMWESETVRKWTNREIDSGDDFDDEDMVG